MTDDPHPPPESGSRADENAAATSDLSTDACARPDESRSPALPARLRRSPLRWVPLVLFLVTCATTFYAGYGQLPPGKQLFDSATGKPILIRVVDSETHRVVGFRQMLKFDLRQTLLNGLVYAAAVMFTL